MEQAVELGTMDAIVMERAKHMEAPATIETAARASVASADAAAGVARPNVSGPGAAGTRAQVRGELDAQRRAYIHEGAEDAGVYRGLPSGRDEVTDTRRDRGSVSIDVLHVTGRNHGQVGTSPADRVEVDPQGQVASNSGKPAVRHPHQDGDDLYDDNSSADANERLLPMDINVVTVKVGDEKVGSPRTVAEIEAVKIVHRSKGASKLMSFLAVAAFWLSHTSSVYATRSLLARPGRTARSVVLITWFQCVASWALVLFLGTLGERLDAANSRWHPRLLTELARALPTNALLGGWNSKTLLGGGAGAVGVASVLFSLAVFTDNACLGVVNASFFQVARALTLPFVTCMGALATGSLPPRDLILPCTLCVLGFALGVRSQTPEAFADGTSMGVMASLLTAAYTLLLARAEPREAWRVTYVTNRNASVLLVPVAVYVGLGDPSYIAGSSFLLRDGGTAFLAVLAAVLPAVAGVSTVWQAQAGLGARGQAASFVGRAACSHLVAFRIFGNSPVLVGEIGCCLVLTGLALYASRRGGAAVAQAGNVAVPAAARDHFLGAEGVAAPDNASKEAIVRPEMSCQRQLHSARWCSSVTPPISTEDNGLTMSISSASSLEQAHTSRAAVSVKRKTSDEFSLTRWPSSAPTDAVRPGFRIVHDEEFRGEFDGRLSTGLRDGGALSLHGLPDRAGCPPEFAHMEGGKKAANVVEAASGAGTGGEDDGATRRGVEGLGRIVPGLWLAKRVGRVGIGVLGRAGRGANHRDSGLDPSLGDRETKGLLEEQDSAWTGDDAGPGMHHRGVGGGTLGVKSVTP